MHPSKINQERLPPPRRQNLCRMKSEPSSVPALRVSARIRTGFPEKFGIPRQSGLVPSLRARIVFEPEYRSPEALRGMEDFTHLWLLWIFSECCRDTWSPTVRPPRLGGNTRVGVFATRSPFRPNPIGLSSVRLERIDLHTPQGPVLTVSGADLMDQTPILDIKPYLPFTDSHPDASGGFADSHIHDTLYVDFPDDLQMRLPPQMRESLTGILASDPRPAYQSDPQRIYSLSYSGFTVRFRVSGSILTVSEIFPETP